MLSKLIEYEKERIALDMQYFWNNVLMAVIIAVIFILAVYIYLFFAK